MKKYLHKYSFRCIIIKTKGLGEEKMDLAQIMETDEKFYMNTFGKRTPAAFTRGEGMYLYDTTGKRYTDFMAGIAVNCLGCGHPRFARR